MSEVASPPTKPTVLVVEDEDSIRMLVQYSLEARGYQVLTARDGEEALTIARDHPGIIDALITDLIMPGLSGADLAKKIHIFRPYMKILLISGNSEASAFDQCSPFASSLAKPFSPSQLLERLKSILQ